MIRSFFSLLLVGTLCLSNQLHANTLFDISSFQVDGYTKNFTKEFDIKMDLIIQDSGKITEIVGFINQSTAKTTNKFGQSWIGVFLTGQFVIEDEKIHQSFLLLYDPKTKRLHHLIDSNDGTMSSYEWKNVPKYMQDGERIKVGIVNEKDPDGKIILVGDVEFQFSKDNNGFEFCTIETNNNLETKQQEITKECDQFDFMKKIVGVKVEVMLGDYSTTTGTGKIILKK